MAVTLSIPLTDNEQAKVIEWLDVLFPNLSGAEKKAALEAHAKRLLRDDLVGRMKRPARQAALDAQAAAVAALNAGADVIDAPDPFEPEA